MGTRGLVGFVSTDGTIKATYNHFDSYPSALGADVAKFIVSHRDSLDDLTVKVDGLKLVNDDEQPTAVEAERVASFTDTSVGNPEPLNWYQALRETQGDLDASLEAGFMVDSGDFALDSLFCEWGYLIDLGNQRLEIYRGFNTQPVTSGRWAGQEGSSDNYYPISLLCAIPFADLPSAENLIDALMGGLEDLVYSDNDDEPTAQQITKMIQEVVKLSWLTS